MTKIDPITAVKDVNISSAWYESVFNCKRTHGGDHFAVLEDENSDVLICLHKWGEHDHPTMKQADSGVGNGLIIYYKTDNLDGILANIRKLNFQPEEDLHLNANSGKREFSLRDPDGYYLLVTDYHNYKG